MQRKFNSKNACLAVVTDKFIKVISRIVTAQNIIYNSITIPLVDHVVAHLQSYFSSSKITLTDGFYLVSYVLYKANDNNRKIGQKNLELLKILSYRFCFCKRHTSRVRPLGMILGQRISRKSSYYSK